MIPFSPGAHGSPSGVTHRGVDARQRDRRRAGLDRQHAEAVRIAEHRAAGLGLPHVIDHRHAVRRGPSFWSHSQAGGLSTSPAQTTRSSRARSTPWQRRVAVRISMRTAVGDVKMPVTPNSSTTIRQLVSGVRDSRARPRRRSWCSRPAAARTRCSCGRRSSRCPTSTTRRRSASVPKHQRPCCGCGPGSRRGCGRPASAWRSCRRWRG